AGADVEIVDSQVVLTDVLAHEARTRAASTKAPAAAGLVRGAAMPSRDDTPARGGATSQPESRTPGAQTDPATTPPPTAPQPQVDQPAPVVPAAPVAPSPAQPVAVPE